MVEIDRISFRILKLGDPTVPWKDELNQCGPLEFQKLGCPPPVSGKMKTKNANSKRQ